MSDEDQDVVVVPVSVQYNITRRYRHVRELIFDLMQGLVQSGYQHVSLDEVDGYWVVTASGELEVALDSEDDAPEDQAPPVRERSSSAQAMDLAAITRELNLIQMDDPYEAGRRTMRPRGEPQP